MSNWYKFSTPVVVRVAGAMLESSAVSIFIAVSDNVPGKYCTLEVAVFSTLPNSWTELENCFWSGPTSSKSLGILFILSFNKTILAVSFISSTGNGVGIGVTPEVFWSG